MTAALWLPPLVRILATGLTVASAAVIAEALGPFWGALIASLPVSAGPAYVFLAIQHGPDFVSASALSSFATNAATGLFLIVYGLLADRTSASKSLGAAVLAWLAASLATRQATWTPLTALLLNLVVYGIGFSMLKTVPGTAHKPPCPVRRRPLDLFVRAVAVAAFVSLIVTVSSVLGPEVTGIATVFPVSLISLIVVVRPRMGGQAASLLAANALRAMLGFGLMLMVLHLMIRPWGCVAALVIAPLLSAAWSVGLLFLSRRRRGSTRQVDLI